ncbi:MAG: hypothetical protein PVJ60_00815 [Phycisphaerales bacterium]|jgi:hypothetical protein
MKKLFILIFLLLPTDLFADGYWGHTDTSSGVNSDMTIEETFRGIAENYIVATEDATVDSVVFYLAHTGDATDISAAVYLITLAGSGDTTLLDSNTVLNVDLDDTAFYGIPVSASVSANDTLAAFVWAENTGATTEIRVWFDMGGGNYAYKVGETWPNWPDPPDLTSAGFNRLYIGVHYTSVVEDTGPPDQLAGPNGGGQLSGPDGASVRSGP